MLGNTSRFTLTIKGIEDELRVIEFNGREGISRPSIFTIKTACENFDLDFDAILQQPAQLMIDDPDSPRYVNGIIHAMGIDNPIGDRFSAYSFELVPKCILLLYRINLKIFQNLTAEGIIQQVLENAELTADDFTFKITTELPTRVYCTQYEESDLDFIQRLMAEDGLHYFFEHTEEKCVMVINDSHYSFPPVPQTPEIEYKRKSGQLITDYFIYEFYAGAVAQPNTVVYRDYNFERPKQDLEIKETAEGSDSALEVYQHNVPYRTPEMGKQKAKTAIKAYQSIKRTGDGLSNDIYLSAGHFFMLENYDDDQYNHHWLMTDVWHQGTQDQVLEELAGAGGSGYANNFKATPRDHVFKTQPLAPKPKIRGAQTAFVTGPEGEEIYCDKYGRVKVQFHWDRDGKNDENSSCWIRVKQPLAGNKWGDLIIPRIGTEVLVKFINGDPDQPIIMGCLYNGKDKPPYKLPDHKTRTTFKTNSSPGGDGFNEIRLEDKKGNEEVFIHAQKDLDIQVKNDKRETIGNERHLTVDNNSYEHVKGEYHQKIDGNYTLKVGQDIHTIIGDSLHGSTGNKYSIQAGNEIHIKAGDKVVIDAGVELTLKGGGSQAKINPSGVHFKAPKIKVSGTPGSGSGVNIQEPNVAVEADKDKAGEEPFAPPEQKEALKSALGWDMICEECVKQQVSDENTDLGDAE